MSMEAVSKKGSWMTEESVFESYSRTNQTLLKIVIVCECQKSWVLQFSEGMSHLSFGTSGCEPLEEKSLKIASH
jgi:hypothetical protein